MRLYRTLAAPGRLKSGRAVTIGAFDGLHIGHQEILRRVLAAAESESYPAAVLSFEPLPAEVLSPSEPPARLTCFRERFELLERFGVEEFFCTRFARVRELTPQAFVDRLLVDVLAARHVVVGHDFRFGLGRVGGVEQLREAGRRFGFGVTIVPPVTVGGRRVSSTAIRAALAAGDLATARMMLGRDYSMSGRVIRGLGLGRVLGFPTANVSLKRCRSPVDGIFAARVAGLGPRLLDGVASVGRRPTIGGGRALLEVLIFDFDGDIYGRHISVHFIERLREERHFAGLESLKAQIARDVDHAREALRLRSAGQAALDR